MNTIGKGGEPGCLLCNHPRFTRLVVGLTRRRLVMTWDGAVQNEVVHVHPVITQRGGKVGLASPSNRIETRGVRAAREASASREASTSFCPPRPPRYPRASERILVI